MIDVKEVATKFYNGMMDSYSPFRWEMTKLKPRKCVECEVIGTGFLLSMSAYMYYLTRLNRINVVGGMLFGLVFFSAGISPLLDRRPILNDGSILINELKKPQSSPTSAEKSKD